jgi:hypothetical protein
MSKADRIIRILLALSIGYLYYTTLLNGVTGIVLLIFAVILLLTGIAGSCPLYSLLVGTYNISIPIYLFQSALFSLPALSGILQGVKFRVY